MIFTRGGENNTPYLHHPPTSHCSAIVASDLKAWADLGAKTSTSDPGVGTVFPAKRILAAGMTRPHRG